MIHFKRNFYCSTWKCVPVPGVHGYHELVLVPLAQFFERIPPGETYLDVGSRKDLTMLKFGPRKIDMGNPAERERAVHYVSSFKAIIDRIAYLKSMTATLSREQFSKASWNAFR